MPISKSKNCKLLVGYGLDEKSRIQALGRRAPTGRISRPTALPSAADDAAVCRSVVNDIRVPIQAFCELHLANTGKQE